METPAQKKNADSDTLHSTLLICSSPSLIDEHSAVDLLDSNKPRRGKRPAAAASTTTTSECTLTYKGNELKGRLILL